MSNPQNYISVIGGEGMAVLKLQKYGSPILREKALPVKKVDKEIKELVDNMIETMYVEGGVAWQLLRWVF